MIDEPDSLQIYDYKSYGVFFLILIFHYWLSFQKITQAIPKEIH